MATHEDGTSKSSGYVEIPIHVLYKTEYIDSVVQQRKRGRSVNNILKKARLRISNTLGKLRDRFSSALRGYYQEIVINNVDGKTRQNMIGYIKSLNLVTKEFVDNDGTRVIVVDIGPIKKKPEMNDLLVYIENEKLKIARRTEAKSKSQDNDDNCNKWSTANRGDVSAGDTTLLSERICVHHQGGGDGVLKCSRGVELEKNKTKSKYKGKQSPLERNIYRKKGLSEVRSENKEISCRTSDSGKARSKEICLEDPLTKAERRVKLRMKSKSKATVRTHNSVVCENVVKTANTSPVSPPAQRNKQELLKFNSLTTNGSSSDRTAWSINSFINPHMKGIGVFWNAQSVIYNDTKINLIERSTAIQEKEKSVNVIAQYYNKEGRSATVEPRKQSSKTSHHEKATEMDESICLDETKALADPHITVNVTEKESTAKDIKPSKNQMKDGPKPLVKLKDTEPYMTNGLMSDPSFQFQEMVTKMECKTVKPSKSVDTGKAEPVKNKKKKKTFTRFVKKLFTIKTQAKKDLEQETVHDECESLPVEVRMKCLTAKDMNKSKGDGNQQELKQRQEKKLAIPLTSRNERKVSNAKIGEVRTDSECQTVSKYPNDRGSRRSKNIYYATDNRRQWLDRGDNIKTLALSDIEESEIELPQRSNNLSFDWRSRLVERRKERHDKRQNVVNKLYRKLKSFGNRKELSDSEITSTSSFTWDDPKRRGGGQKYCYDDFTLSSLDSVQVSVDTVQSVTQTVIKKLAKSYPKKKIT